MTETEPSIPEWRRRLFPALPVLALAYGGGTIAGAILGGHWLVTALLATCIALAARLRGDPRLWLPIAAIALAAAGHARIATIDATPPPPLAAMTEEHEVIGVVRKDAVLSGILQRVDLSVETVDGAAMTGGIRLRLPTIGMPLQAGERIRFTARLDPPGMIEAFDYVEFLRDWDIHLIAAFPRDWERIDRVDLGWRGALFELRRNLLSRIERTLPEPHAALAAGVLIGVQGTLPDDLEHVLRNTGSTHLVVVSGQNVALLFGIAAATLTPVISRRYAAVLTLALLPGYVVFVSADPPVVRAAIMAVAVVAADVTGRRTPEWLYLGYAVVVMLAIEPRLVRDVAFQLSATATAGITTLAPVMRDAVIARWPRLDTPARTAVVCIAATATGAALAVLPVQVAAFEVIALDDPREYPRRTDLRGYRRRCDAGGAARGRRSVRSTAHRGAGGVHLAG